MYKNRLPMDDPDEAALQELDAALARWGIETNEHGLIRTADLRRAVADGRIKPSVWTPEYQELVDKLRREQWTSMGLGHLLEPPERNEGQTQN